MKWLAIILVALFSGCGTVRNFSPVWNDDQPTACNAAIYGGVRTDVAEIKSAVRDLGRFPHPESQLLTNSSTIVCNTIDTPLSLVGDTVTLHRTIPATITRAVVDSYRRSGAWEDREKSRAKARAENQLASGPEAST